MLFVCPPLPLQLILDPALTSSFIVGCKPRTELCLATPYWSYSHTSLEQKRTKAFQSIGGPV